MKKIIDGFNKIIDWFIEVGHGITFIFGLLFGFVISIIIIVIVMKPINEEFQFEIYDEVEFYAIDGNTMLMIQNDILIEVDISYKEIYHSYEITKPIIYRKYHYEKLLWFDKSYYEYRIILPFNSGE